MDVSCIRVHLKKYMFRNAVVKVINVHQCAEFMTLNEEVACCEPRFSENILFGELYTFPHRLLLELKIELSNSMLTLLQV